MRIEISGTRKYLKYLKNHLKREHPKTKNNIKIRR